MKGDMLPYRIYLSGGGMCAIAHVGALIELNNHIPIKLIKEWMGVSAGSLVAMCLCIGYTLQELEDISVRFDFTNVKDYDSVPGWILHFGLDTGERLMKLVQACLHIKGLPSNFTFQECQERFGKSLRIVAADLNEAKSVTFSPIDTPTYTIADAVRASMGYPYYFQPHVCPVTGHLLVDGGVISNYPLFVVPKEEHSSTLSILIRTCVEKKEDLADAEIETLIARPLQMVFIEKTNIEAKFYDARCIQIMLGDLNILEFAFDEETKHFIINKGKEAVQHYFKNTPQPKRRHSIS
uniref:PNPLA domain-containing protein n=1 Tax=viral metagenome TaxID=1070528 RepID=A0A6C0KPV0_9ZZZZ